MKTKKRKEKEITIPEKDFKAAKASLKTFRKLIARLKEGYVAFYDSKTDTVLVRKDTHYT